MSSLSEQERIGLEEVFLSISSSRNFFQKWSFLGKKTPFRLNDTKSDSSLILASKSRNWLNNGLKNHKITKLFNKLQKRRKN
ncbi:MAG: hypothetical protein AB7D20_04140 [Sulfuricurvum sp.]|uniref:hypothetical protein n=1 Tax=Sulfuricurvum sp. TaxID=2025608 RepID=UPI003D0A5F9A